MAEHVKTTETLYPGECAWGDCSCEVYPCPTGMPVEICAECTWGRACAESDQPCPAVWWEEAERTDHEPVPCCAAEEDRRSSSSGEGDRA